MTTDLRWNQGWDIVRDNVNVRFMFGTGSLLCFGMATYAARRFIKRPG